MSTVQYHGLAGKRVVVTGGASGIGAVTVAAFAGQGCQVHSLDVQDELGQAVVAAHEGASYHHCDLTDVAAIRRTIAEIEAMGGIDAVVNNAANDQRHGLYEMEPEYWRNRLAINLDHQFFVTQAVAKRMEARGSGSIILTSSTSWMKGRPGMVAYTTSKAAIIGLTRTLAREVGGSGVRVNCIVPGAIATERQLTLWRTPDMEAEFMATQALKIQLQPGHVAAMALFLASDQSAGCTGAQFLVDAGLT